MAVGGVGCVAGAAVVLVEGMVAVWAVTIGFHDARGIGTLMSKGKCHSGSLTRTEVRNRVEWAQRLLNGRLEAQGGVDLGEDMGQLEVGVVVVEVKRKTSRLSQFCQVLPVFQVLDLAPKV